MTYSRLYFNGNLSENLSSYLDKSQSHYIAKVMRIKEGENFSLFNNNGEWQAKVVAIKKNIIKFIIVKKLKNIEIRYLYFLKRKLKANCMKYSKLK